MIPIIGALGVATEASGWYFSKGSLQNATDAAAMAAAANIAGGSTPATCDYSASPATGTPCAEVRGVFANYGYVNGTTTDKVRIKTTAGVTCPSGAVAGTCYQVEVTKYFPVRMLAVAGFKGDTQIGSARYQSVYATATIGKSLKAGNTYCVLALGTSGNAIQSNGAPSANLAGCNIMSNANARCNGHNLGAEIGDAAGTNSGCGVAQNSNVPAVADPYAALASNIPADSCPSYPVAPAKKKDPDLRQKWTSAGVPVGQLCGSQVLTEDVTINTSGPIIIYNGSLDLDGHTLQTANGVSATIIFAAGKKSGTDPNDYLHYPTGDGTIDFNAPSSGTWSGIAMYQDPSITDGVSFSYAGNSPTWKLSGMVYLPHASVTFSGAVNKSANGKSCFGLVVNDLTINGTGQILAHGECADAGLTLPSGSTPGRMVLLQ